MPCIIQRGKAAHHPRGGIAKLLNALRIESFNVVLKRDFFDLVVDEGATAFVRDKLTRYRGVVSVSTGEGIIAVQFSDPSRLESLVKALIDHGFTMTVDGKFEDFALVHGRHGLSMPCDWLGFRSDEEGGMVWLRTSIPEQPSAFSDVYDWDSMGWITERGHGFMLSRDDHSDVWLDFHSGRTIVSLKESARARGRPFS